MDIFGIHNEPIHDQYNSKKIQIMLVEQHFYIHPLYILVLPQKTKPGIYALDPGTDTNACIPSNTLSK